MGIKIRINSEDEFKKVQEIIYKNGGTWSDGINYIINLDELIDDCVGISVDYDEDIKSLHALDNLNMSYFDYEDDFIKDDNIEISYNDFLKIKDVRNFVKSI